MKGGFFIWPRVLWKGLNTMIKSPDEDSLIITEEDQSEDDSLLFGLFNGFGYITLNQFLKTVTDYYIADNDITPENHPSYADIEYGLMFMMSSLASILNDQIEENSRKIRCPKTLTPGQITDLVFATNHIVRINLSGVESETNSDILAMYVDSGKNEGTYVYEANNDSIKSIIKCLNYKITESEKKAVMERIYEDAPRVMLTTDPKLIPVANGVFNFDTKELLEFSPDYIFMGKSQVEYNPGAVDVLIRNEEDGTVWSVDSWMSELSDDQEIVMVLWEVLASVVRPFVSWNKSAWLYSNVGCNGKGTLCELMRLLSPGSVSLQLKDFSERFGLEKLIGKTAIICDENDVGEYIDRAGNLKAVITNDVVSVDRKGRPVVDIKFKGMSVFCVNEKPRIKDRSSSLYRRILIIPCDKSFTGKERKYIKNDYIHRKEVLEYILYRLLHMNFHEFDEPKACADALAEYKEFNDTVRQFLDDVLSELVWDLVPNDFLYDLYKGWFRKNCPSGSVEGKNKFLEDVRRLLPEYPEWTTTGEHAKRTANLMDKTEYMICAYDLRDWFNDSYVGPERSKICDIRRQLKTAYRGLLRVGCNNADESGNDLEMKGA